MALFKKKKVKVDENEVRKLLANLAAQDASVFPGHVGDTVRVINGPFEGLSGTVLEIVSERNVVRLSIDIYGGPTPIEQHFSWIRLAS